MSLFYAKELMEEFPEETKGFTVFQVEKIWEDYSDTMAASWINPNKETVKNIFDQFRNHINVGEVGGKE